MQSLSEILHKKTYVGNVFSLHAKIILSNKNSLFKNAINVPKQTAITDLVTCHLKSSK